MRKATLISLTFAIALMFSCSTKTEKHIGEWKGTDNNGTTTILTLDKTSHATLKSNNEMIGGDNFEISGMKVECKYEMDYTKNPMWLDIVLIDIAQKQEKGRLKGIVKFITDTKMELRLNTEGNRFDSFDAKDKTNTMLFEKVVK